MAITWSYQKHLEAFFMILASFPPCYKAHIHNPQSLLLSFIQNNTDYDSLLQNTYQLYLQESQAQDLQWIILQTDSEQDLIRKLEQTDLLIPTLKDYLLSLYSLCFNHIVPALTSLHIQAINDLLTQLLPDLILCRHALFKRHNPLHLLHIPSLTQYARVYQNQIICDLSMPEAHSFCQILHESTHQVTDSLFLKRHPHLISKTNQSTQQFLASPTHDILERLAVRHSSRIIQHICPHRIVQDQQWRILYHVADV